MTAPASIRPSRSMGASTLSVAPRPPSRCADLTRFVVKTFGGATGRGPTKARASISADVATVVMQDTLTRYERSLLDAGRAEVVAMGRAAIHDVLRADLAAGAEAVLGRRVLSVHLDHQAAVDVVVAAFVFAPDDASGAASA